MTDQTAARRIVVREQPAELADLVADRFVTEVRALTDAGRTVHVSLTGGTMGIATLRTIAAHPGRDGIDWSRVHFWWSDERFVPRDHADRNAGQARDALLDAIAVPAGNIHEMPASDEGEDLDAAAQRYAAELARFGDGATTPAFDICFLGVGPDAHIASLFPGRDEVHVTDAIALAVRDSPKPPPERITLTLPVINGSESVWLVMAGADKAAALSLLAADADIAEAPAAGARGRTETVVYADRAAAAEINA